MLQACDVETHLSRERPRRTASRTVSLASRTARPPRSLDPRSRALRVPRARLERPSRARSLLPTVSFILDASPLVGAELSPDSLHFSLRPLQIWVARRRRADDEPAGVRGLHGRRFRRGAAEGGAVLEVALRVASRSRRSAPSRDRALDRASIILDARSGIGVQDLTHDAPAARRSAAANHRRARMACLGVDGAGEVKSR